jgi:hypothetical protein
VAPCYRPACTGSKTGLLINKIESIRVFTRKILIEIHIEEYKLIKE